MSAAIREPMRDVIDQVAAEMAARNMGYVRLGANVTTVNLDGYTVVKLWADRGLKFRVELDDKNWDTAHEEVHLERARTAVHRALKTVTDRLLGVAEVRSVATGQDHAAGIGSA